MMYEMSVPCNSDCISELRDVTNVSIKKNQNKTINSPETHFQFKPEVLCLRAVILCYHLS